MIDWDRMAPAVKRRRAFLHVVGIDTDPSLEDVQRLYREGWSTAELAEALHMNQRTVQRMVSDRTPCPGERCATMVRGGGLCSFCRR